MYLYAYELISIENDLILNVKVSQTIAWKIKVLLITCITE